MAQVLEYISQYYTWFLFGGIIILLAVIGYYADKTNFGQGKNSDNKEKNDTNDKLKKLENTRLMDATNNNDSLNDENVKSELATDDTNDINLTNSVQTAEKIENSLSLGDMQLPDEQVGLENDSKINEDLVVESEIVTPSSNNNLMANDVLGSEQLIEENSFDQREAEFEKIDAEIELMLPQQDLINDSLLNDIDDLELGKTQRIDLNTLPKLDDIELPKINSTAKKSQDIWKF